MWVQLSLVSLTCQHDQVSQRLGPLCTSPYSLHEGLRSVHSQACPKHSRPLP